MKDLAKDVAINQARSFVPTATYADELAVTGSLPGSSSERVREFERVIDAAQNYHRRHRNLTNPYDEGVDEGFGYDESAERKADAKLFKDIGQALVTQLMLEAITGSIPLSTYLPTLLPSLGTAALNRLYRMLQNGPLPAVQQHPTMPGSWIDGGARRRKMKSMSRYRKSRKKSRKR